MQNGTSSFNHPIFIFYSFKVPLCFRLINLHYFSVCLSPPFSPHADAYRPNLLSCKFEITDIKCTDYLIQTSFPICSSKLAYSSLFLNDSHHIYFPWQHQLILGLLLMWLRGRDLGEGQIWNGTILMNKFEGGRRTFLSAIYRHTKKCIMTYNNQRNLMQYYNYSFMIFSKAIGLRACISSITSIRARQIFDSRGNPTI